MQEAVGRLWAPCQGMGRSPNGRKLGAGALPGSQEGWASSEKGMCLLPCLDTINQSWPPCLTSGWSSALYPPSFPFSAHQSRGPKTMTRSPRPRCGRCHSHPTREKQISLASAQSCTGPTARS